MDVLDLLLTPVYLLLFYFLARRTISRNGNNPLYRQYYLKGLYYKFGATIFFALIYIYYYKGGDSLSFYYTVSPTFKLFFSDQKTFWRFITGLQPFYPVECMYEADAKGVMYLLRGSPSLTTIRLATLLNMISFNSYIVLCLWFAYISYIFQFMAFKVLASIYPTLHKHLSYAFLMVPSVLFWGSGVGKDSIMLGAILLVFCTYYHMVILKKEFLKNAVILIITAYLITLIRSFVLYAMIPSLLLMTATYYRGRINSTLLKVLAGPILIVGGAGVSLLFIQGLGQSVESYSLDSLQQKAEGFKSWHSYLGETQGGSSYTIGLDLEYTPMGILKAAPFAIMITLYGPFIWQANSVVMLLSVIESMFFMLVTARILLNRKIYSLIGILAKDHILVFCLPLIIILSAAIGLTSFNYGALVRYKIPVLPFFATFLVVINYHLTSPLKRA